MVFKKVLGFEVLELMWKLIFMMLRFKLWVKVKRLLVELSEVLNFMLRW